MLNGRCHDGLRFSALCSNFLILNLSIFRLIDRQVGCTLKHEQAKLQRAHQLNFPNEEKENDRSMPIRPQWPGNSHSLYVNFIRSECTVMAAGNLLQSAKTG
ncbi:hypothetical protein WH297_08235 [Ochrobactrum vermis]|uniref:Uncharacterized protein n=1 Tax=Ochrobactrum vermis TaxID=1827297 RepID=A0ABU8PCA1_9HYPH